MTTPDPTCGAEPLSEEAWFALAEKFNPWRAGPVPEDATVEIKEDGSLWRWCLPPGEEA